MLQILIKSCMLCMDLYILDVCVMCVHSRSKLLFRMLVWTADLNCLFLRVTNSVIYDKYGASCRTLVYGVSLLIRVNGVLIMAMDKVMMPMLMEPPRILHYMHMVHMLVMRNTLNRQGFTYFSCSGQFLIVQLLIMMRAECLSHFMNLSANFFGILE